MTPKDHPLKWITGIARSDATTQEEPNRIPLPWEIEETPCMKLTKSLKATYEKLALHYKSKVKRSMERRMERSPIEKKLYSNQALRQESHIKG
jgi:hypothetical protein